MQFCPPFLLPFLFQWFVFRVDEEQPGGGRREAVLQMVFTTMYLQAIVPSALADTGALSLVLHVLYLRFGFIVLFILFPEVPEDFKVYSDEVNKFKIQIPLGDQQFPWILYFIVIVGIEDGWIRELGWMQIGRWVQENQMDLNRWRHSTQMKFLLFQMVFKGLPWSISSLLDSNPFINFGWWGGCCLQSALSSLGLARILRDSSPLAMWMLLQRIWLAIIQMMMMVMLTLPQRFFLANFTVTGEWIG